jgi:hypothetical protein
MIMRLPRKLHPGTALLSGFLLVTLAFTSCKPAAPGAAGEAAPAASGSSVPADPSSAAVPATAPATAAPAKTGPAKPRPHREIMTLVDFSKFPKFPGATRESTFPVVAGFSVPKKDASTPTQAIAALETFLTSQGWKVAADAGAPWDAMGGSRFYEKAGARIQASAGVSRGFPQGEDVNASLTLTGEVDARTLPRFPGSKMTHSDFASASFVCPADLIAVRKFHEAQLVPLGWHKYRDYIPGYEPPMEQIEKDQRFVQNGVSILYLLTRKGSETEVSVRVSVLPVALPIPPKTDLLQLRDSPAMLSCFVPMSESEALAWFQDALGKEGWTSKEVPPVEERTRRYEFRSTSAPKPLILALLPSGKDTVVQLREAN